MYSKKNPSVGSDKLSHEAITIAELVSYIEDIKLTDEATIKLFQVVDLYKARLEQVGGDIPRK